MSITDELTNMVNPHMITGLQSQHIMSPTPTCNLLSGMLRKKTGAAGNGVQITDLIEQGDGRFYRGLDPAENRRANEGTVGHFEQWTNLQEDVVIAGTQLQEVLGMNVSQVVKADTSLKGFSKSDRLTFINLAAMRAEQAAVSGMADIDRALWGDYLPGDNRQRMPLTLDQVFDETGTLHGLGPADLGSWEPGKQVWGDNPINDLTGDQQKYRHIPQIFTSTGNLSADAGFNNLLEANVKMSANVTGYWLAPTHPDLYLALDKKLYDDGIQHKVPLYSAGNWKYQTESIRIQNSFYYVEQRAPSDRIRHLHVGMMDGRGGSFFPFAWMGPDSNIDIESLLTADDPTPNLDGLPLGDQGNKWPWFMQMWQLSQQHASAIYCELEIKFMWLCLYRWKQFECRGATTS